MFSFCVVDCDGDLRKERVLTHSSSLMISEFFGESFILLLDVDG